MQRPFFLFYCFIVFFFAHHKALCQDSTLSTVVSKPRHSIGAGAGFTTGYGLSYRYQPGRFGAQVNFAPYHSTSTDRYSFGVTFLYTVIQNKASSLFLYQGNHYYYNSRMEELYPVIPPYDPYSVRKTEGYVNNGLGFGFELVLFKKVGLNLMTGYAFYDTFKEVNITGEVALYYKF